MNFPPVSSLSLLIIVFLNESRFISFGADKIRTDIRTNKTKII